MKTSRSMTNAQIAELLRAVKAVLEIKNASRFRIAAYDRAAVSIEHLTTEVKDLWESDELEQIPGVGTSIAESLAELFKTGKVKDFEKLFKAVPPAFFVFLKLRGVGAKTARKLCENLKITKADFALARLEKAARKGEIRLLEGFGEESEADILRSISQLNKQGKKRILFYQARGVAKELIDYLGQCPQVETVVPLGSLRRKAATVGDIDLAASTGDESKVLDWFIQYRGQKQVLARGDNTARVLLKNHLQVDLKTEPPESFGSLIQHFTGSKQHNISLRERALKKGLSLSEHGIKEKRSGRLIKFADEREFYQYLGLDWIPPELREDRGEIEAAEGKKLPVLVELSDVRGDLHVHSDFDLEPSHDLGENSLDELVEWAIEHQYEYLGLSEHNPSLKHRPAQVVAFLEKKRDWIGEKNARLRKQVSSLRLLNGLEVDVRPDGQLALPDRAFDLLDYVIASVHSSFNQTPTQMTQRILRALSYPRVRILGHPTGRIIQKRESVEADWAKIFDLCKQKEIALEVNSCPERLDLPEELVRMAVSAGVKIAICSDAHRVEELGWLPYGVNNARRGWAAKTDVVNTWNQAKLVGWLKVR